MTDMTKLLDLISERDNMMNRHEQSYLEDRIFKELKSIMVHHHYEIFKESGVDVSKEFLDCYFETFFELGYYTEYEEVIENFKIHGALPDYSIDIASVCNRGYTDDQAKVILSLHEVFQIDEDEHISTNIEYWFDIVDKLVKGGFVLKAKLDD